MKGDPLPVLHGSTPYERFIELGKKLMSVSKSEVLELEKKWHAQKRRLSRRTSK